MRGAVATYWTDLQQRTAPAPASRRRPVPSLLCVALAAVAACILATRLAGLQPLTVLTGSMSPSIDRGDLVLVDRIAAARARPGDVITFSSPDGRDRTITHRVVSVRPRDGGLAFVTKGDANPAAERWTIATGGLVGRVRANVPYAGYAARPLAAGLSRGVLLALLTAAGAAAALWLIWRPAPR